MTLLNEKAKHRGVAFEHLDGWIIIPPLTVGQMLDQKIAEAMDLNTPVPFSAPPAEADVEDHVNYLSKVNAFVRARADAFKTVIHSAVLRNYPNMSDAEFEEFVTLDNYREAFAAATGNSPKETKKVRSPEELAPR
jgi:hypothetical protein